MNVHGPMLSDAGHYCQAFIYLSLIECAAMKKMRFEEALGLIDQNQSEIARALGVSRQAVSNWRAGAPIAFEHALKLEKVYGINHIWLLTGSGERTITKDALRCKIDQMLDSMTEDQRVRAARMIALLRQE